MQNEQLKKYIQDHREQGFSDAAIRQELTKVGWPQGVGDETFISLGESLPAQAVPEPAPPGSVISTDGVETQPGPVVSMPQETMSESVDRPQVAASESAQSPLPTAPAAEPSFAQSIPQRRPVPVADGPVQSSDLDVQHTPLKKHGKHKEAFLLIGALVILIVAGVIGYYLLFLMGGPEPTSDPRVNTGQNSAPVTSPR